MKNVKKKLLVLAVSGVVAVLCAELVLRVFFTAYVTQIYTLDSELLHRLIPGAEKYFVHHPSNGGERVWIGVNSDGYRGEELRERGEHLRVAVFGDSFVMGEFSELEDTFAEQVERQLAERLGKDVEAVNAGVVAYGPDQSLLRMERELPRLNPDLAVVCIFCDNDYGDLLRNKLFRINATGTGLVRNSVTISPKLEAKFAEGVSSTAIYRVLKRWYRGMRMERAAAATEAATEEQKRAAAYAFIDGWVPECAREFREFVAEHNDAVQFLFEDHYDADIAVDPEGEAAVYKLKLMGLVIQRMRTVCGEQGVPLAIVAIPSPADVCGLSHGALVDPGKYPRYDARRLTQSLVEIAGACQVPCLDLFEPYSDRGASELYFLPPDNHWNDEGQAIAAELLVKLVVDRSLIGGN